MFNLTTFISDSVTFRPVSMFAADTHANKGVFPCEMGAELRKVHTDVRVFGYGGKCFPKDVNAFAKMTEGTPLGTLLEHLHELNVHFRGVEEHI